MCYVDISEQPPIIKLDSCEEDVRFGQSQMQHLFHEQSKSHSKDINLVRCIGNALISIVDSAHKLEIEKQKLQLFENSTLTNIVEKLIKALGTFAKADFSRTQKLYSDWNQLQRALSYFISQDFGFFLVDSDSQRAKIRLLNCTLKLIKKTVMNPDDAVQTQVAAEIRKHLSLENLR